MRASWLLPLLVIIMSMTAPHRGVATSGGFGPAKYYVDSRDGNDRNDGKSPRRAWRTLGPVNSERFHPGDRLLCRAGTRYQGQLDLHGSGTPENPIEVGIYGTGSRPPHRAA